VPPRRLEPYRQGHLDGLCGVYSVVNAVRHALLHVEWRRSDRRGKSKRLGHDEVEALFALLLTSITRSRRGPKCVFEGTTPGQISTMLRTADQWLRQEKGIALSHRRPLGRRARSTTLLRHIDLHLAQPGTATIVGGKRLWEHWTVATRVTPARLHLLDSGGDRSIAVDRGPVDRPRQYHAGILDPSCLYLITLRAPMAERR